MIRLNAFFEVKEDAKADADTTRADADTMRARATKMAVAADTATKMPYNIIFFKP